VRRAVATAKTTDDYIDAGMSTVSASLMAARAGIPTTAAAGAVCCLSPREEE